MREPNPKPVDGPVEVLIVTYATPTMRCSGKLVSDFDWLVHCLRSARKWLKGFQGITIVHPNHEAEKFRTLLDQFDVRLHGFAEIPGKGFLQHEIKMAQADLIVPSSTKYVLHCDADCIFCMETRPEHYFWNDRPYHIVRSWESLTTEDPQNPGSKVVSDCAQWRTPTDEQLGFRTEIYGMCMNTGAFPMEFYARYREHVERTHRKPFEQYMMEGQNNHPATRMDWTAMNAFAYHKMRDRFHWFRVETPPYPVDRKQAFWSHGGFNSEVDRQIEDLIQHGR